MAINARMQQKRGNEADFDPDKMLPGEWAVSVDTKYVRMCFAPGVCVRMATYEAFEADMEQIIAILEEAKTIQEAVELIQTEINGSVLVVEEYVSQAKQFSETAKSEADRSALEADRAKSEADRAEKYGVTDYEQLNNKPRVNGVELIGDKSTSDLGITAESIGADLSGSASVALSDAKGYTDEKIANLINGAPETLDTLKEISDALAESEDAVEAINQAIGSKLDKTGDSKDNTVTFTQVSERTNIVSTENHSTLFGKIAKWFSDLKTVAFSGSYNDLSETPTIPTVPTPVNNLLATVAGSPLDAVQGKVLDDKVIALENKFKYKVKKLQYTYADGFRISTSSANIGESTAESVSISSVSSGKFTQIYLQLPDAFFEKYSADQIIGVELNSNYLACPFLAYNSANNYFTAKIMCFQSTTSQIGQGNFYFKVLDFSNEELATE